MLVKLFLPLYFIPLDPDSDPRTQMNRGPTGSGSTSLNKTRDKQSLVPKTARKERHQHFLRGACHLFWSRLRGPGIVPIVLI